MAWGNPGYPQSGNVTFIPLPSGGLEAFGPDGHSLGILAPTPPAGGNGKVAIVSGDVTEQDYLDAKLKVGATLAKSTGTSGGSDYLQLDSNAALSDVLGVGADAGGVTITGLGAPVNPDDAARLVDVGSPVALPLPIVQQAQGQGGATLGAAPTAGNTLILFGGINGAGHLVTAITQIGVTWTKLHSYEGNSSALNLWIGIVGAGAAAAATWVDVLNYCTITEFTGQPWAGTLVAADDHPDAVSHQYVAASRNSKPNGSRSFRSSRRFSNWSSTIRNRQCGCPSANPKMRRYSSSSRSATDERMLTGISK